MDRRDDAARHPEELSGGPEPEHRATLDALFDAVHVVDPELRVLFMNARFLAWMAELGLPGDPVGRPLFEVFPFLPERVRDEYRRVVEGGETVVTEETTPLGERAFHTETRKIPIVRDGRVVRVVTAVHDLTAQREAEEQRRALDRQIEQARRLESLGVLAGGIAHDFNNLLTAIVGHLSLVRPVVSDPAAQHSLDEAERAGQRATALTTQLITFARGGAPRRRSARLATLVREAGFCLDGSPVRPEFDLRDEASIAVDAVQIGQVIQNLAVNAREAMPAGGVVRFATRDLEEHGRRWVELTVSDEGPGIPPEHLRRIFDPYFTTKPRGTGLGLAVAHSVVSRHGGRLTVQSTAGRGATFTVRLPADDAASSLPDAAEPSTTGESGYS